MISPHDAEHGDAALYVANLPWPLVGVSDRFDADELSDSILSLDALAVP
jgi:hypothetical protein